LSLGKAQAPSLRDFLLSFIAHQAKQFTVGNGVGNGAQAPVMSTKQLIHTTLLNFWLI